MRLAVEAMAGIIKLFFWMVANQTPRKPCFLAGPCMAALGTPRGTTGCG